LISLTASFAQTVEDTVYVCPGVEQEFFVLGTETSAYNWDVGNALVGSFNHNDTVGVKAIWDEPGIYEVNVFEHTQTDCYGTYTQYIKVYNSTVLNVEDIEACPGDPVVFEAVGDYIDYLWSDGSISSSITTRGVGNHWVQVTDENGCTYTDTMELVHLPAPIIDLGPDTMLCSHEGIVIDIEVDDYTTIEWSKGTDNNFETEILATVEDANDEIRVLVTNSYNCRSHDTLFIMPCTIPDFIEIKTAITPNGDGANDKWIIDFLEYYPSVTVQIFDRWGNQVFSSTGYSEAVAWDGTYNGNDVPMDSYYYVIDLNLEDGSYPFTGNITVVR
jgi:gliding motility-associated-like protein